MSKRLATGALVAALTATAIAPRPALADGAASTRNIIFGAAAVGGALLIINHNKKVHEKYAEYDRQQAATQAEANNAEAAYQSEQQAYSHESAINSELDKEVAYQHHVVVTQQRRIASLEHSLQVAKASTGSARNSTFTQQTAVAPVRVEKNPPATAQYASTTRSAQTVSYGWGSY